MKKKYLQPAAFTIKVDLNKRPLCGSETELSPLQEKGDLDLFEWDYN
jgi:hypothetical protein